MDRRGRKGRSRLKKDARRREGNGLLRDVRGNFIRPPSSERAATAKRDSAAARSPPPPIARMPDNG